MGIFHWNLHSNSYILVYLLLYLITAVLGYIYCIYEIHIITLITHYIIYKILYLLPYVFI